MKRFCLFLYISFSLIICAAAVQPAYATQTHGAPEGLYVHQFSHLFFILAMGILIYWLRSRSLVQQKGWRLIQYAAVFFILWSLDAFLVHLIDEQTQWITLERISRWEMRMAPAGGHAWLSWFYYLLKLDHAFCLPGMIFLYAGLRNLSNAARADETPRDGGL